MGLIMVRTLGITLILLIVAFAAVILLQISSLFLGPSKRACTKKVCLSKFLEGPPAFNDERLKGYLREKFVIESSGPPNYSTRVGYTPEFEEALEYIKTHFNNKRGGTFVVLGAGDGEYRDLTLPLEKELDWSGLLIEPHPELFERMKEKGRKATLVNNCVSPFAYPTMAQISHAEVSPGDSAMVKLEKYRKTKIGQLYDDDTGLATLKVQCIPVENLLYAGGIEKYMDLMILDMSGSDLDVLVNVKMDLIPDVEMIVMISNGANVAADVGGYFLDKNLVMKKVIGKTTNDSIFILTKFKGEEDL